LRQDQREFPPCEQPAGALSDAGLSINHKDLNNPPRVPVGIFSATMHRHVRIGSEPDRRAVRIFDGWFPQPRYQIDGFD
jgi:hypothetical protein